MANRTPFGLALSMQREATRMGQRTVEQGLDAQRTMTEAFVRNAIGMGRVANRNATEATRQSAVVVAGMMDAMVPGGASTSASVDARFDSVAAVQENVWRVFEESAENGLNTYAEFTRGGMDAFTESIPSAMGGRERRREAADAAVEYERQRPEDIATDRGVASEGEATSEPLSETESSETEPGEAGDEGPETVTTGPEAETTAEPEVETGREEPPAAGERTAGPELTDLSGVGTAYAERLRAADIDSVEQLLDADVAELSEATEISDERLSNWQRQARHLLDEE